MTTPAERLKLAADNLHAADHTSTGNPATDRNAEVEVTRRLAYAQAESLIAIGELLTQILERTPSVIDIAGKADQFLRDTGPVVRDPFESPPAHVRTPTMQVVDEVRRLANGGWSDAEPLETLRQIADLLTDDVLRRPTR
jgi:hypothetical protein